MNPDEINDRPPRRPTRREDYDDDYDDEDFDDRPPPRNSSDATGGLIPYKNPKALAAYYCGIFGLISCFLALGIFGILPIIFGIQGLKHAKKYPKTSGQAHAIIGIVLGVLEVVTFLATWGIVVAASLAKK